MEIHLILERELIVSKDIMTQVYLHLIVGWRGFSGNHGNPSEKNLYLDGKATIDWILKNTKFKIKDIVNYGESLGTGVAVELNLKYNFCVLYLRLLLLQLLMLLKTDIRIYPTKLSC